WATPWPFCHSSNGERADLPSFPTRRSSDLDVKKLRDLTDAPMMECKAALEEAEGDFEKAQEILKQKGKAAAGKRVDRATGEGVRSEEHTSELQSRENLVCRLLLEKKNRPVR